MADLSGQCLCGAVRFTAKGANDDFGACYCDMCRRWTGSFYTGVATPVSGMTIEGENNVKVVKTSDWASRAHCGHCGSALWYIPHETDIVSMGVGLLDDASGLVLKRESYTDKKPKQFGPPIAENQMTSAEVDAWVASQFGDGKND